MIKNVCLENAFQCCEHTFNSHTLKLLHISLKLTRTLTKQQQKYAQKIKNYNLQHCFRTVVNIQKYQQN